jgi:hypothetical protein
MKKRKAPQTRRVCDASSTGTRLVTQIDRLEELKIQLEFNRTAAQISQAVKDGDVGMVAEEARNLGLHSVRQQRSRHGAKSLSTDR